MRMHLRIKEGCSSSSFKQERYQVCKNVCSVAVGGGACVWNCRYAVSLSDRSPCFPSLYASLCLSSFTGRLIIHPPDIIRQTEGEPLSVTCIYRGSGTGELGRWIGPAVPRRARVMRGSSKSILHFSELIAEDNGTYVCLFGNEAATVEIIVHSEYVCTVVNVH